MKRFELFVGHNYNDGLLIWSDSEVYAAITNACMAYEIDAFTRVDGVGYWHGQSERSTVLTILGPPELYLRVSNVAINIAKTLRQECVLVCESECRICTLGGES